MSDFIPVDESVEDWRMRKEWDAEQRVEAKRCAQHYCSTAGYDLQRALDGVKSASDRLLRRYTYLQGLDLFFADNPVPDESGVDDVD